MKVFKEFNNYDTLIWPWEKIMYPTHDTFRQLRASYTRPTVLTRPSQEEKGSRHIYPSSFSSVMLFIITRAISSFNPNECKTKDNALRSMPAGIAEQKIGGFRLMDAVCMQFRHNLEKTRGPRGIPYVEKR